jgi:hypothetical protein
MQVGYPPVNVKFADRKRYYACFDSYYQDNDASPLVEMVAGYVKGQFSQMLQILQSQKD